MGIHQSDCAGRGRDAGAVHVQHVVARRPQCNRQLCLKHGERIRQKPGEVPVIALDVGSYQHRNRAYGEIRFPVFRIVDWMPAKDLPPIEGASEQQQLEVPDDDNDTGALM